MERGPALNKKGNQKRLARWLTRKRALLNMEWQWQDAFPDGGLQPTWSPEAAAARLRRMQSQPRTRLGRGLVRGRTPAAHDHLLSARPPISTKFSQPARIASHLSQSLPALSARLAARDSRTAASSRVRVRTIARTCARAPLARAVWSLCTLMLLTRGCDVCPCTLCSPGHYAARVCACCARRARPQSAPFKACSAEHEHPNTEPPNT